MSGNIVCFHCGLTKEQAVISGPCATSTDGTHMFAAVEHLTQPQYREPTGERFSVYQYFCNDGGYDREGQHVPLQVAMRMARHLSESVGGRIGTTVRIIITDSGDCIVWEWKYKEGVVFPKP